MENRFTHHKWKEIPDLPEDLYSLRDQERESLYQIWTEEKVRLADDKSVSEFNDQLAREWAIETGIIEGVTMFSVSAIRTRLARFNRDLKSGWRLVSSTA